MMIVPLFIFFNYILSLLKKKYADKEIGGDGEHESNSRGELSLRELEFEGDAEVTEYNVRFFPPAYIQRYRAVADVINFHKKQGNIRKVVDFGCSELSFFTYVKHLEGVEEYIGVDIDGDVLERNHSKTSPLTSDFLTKRCSPLKIFILKGSVTDPDIRLKDTNVVIAIELIEHMYPNEVNSLPYNIFGVIQPEIAIFTTPNSDFNVLFPNFTGFRHEDHKFEWSREQFEDWGKNVTAQYSSYDVTFHGIGKGPTWTEHLGCCSQMAVFIRNTTQVLCSDKEFSEIHECTYEVDYPYQTLEQKLNDILEYEVYQFISKISRTRKYVVGEQREVPVDDLLKTIGVECSVDKLVEFLITAENDVKYINNAATLILPYYGSDDGDDNISTGSSYNDENDSVIGCQNEENWVFEEDTQCWDVDLINVESEKMNDNVDELNWGSPKKNASQGNTDVDLFEPVASSSNGHVNDCHPTVLNNELDLDIDESLNSSQMEIAEKTIPGSLEINKPTGAIPKQHITLSKAHSSSTSVSSSEETEIQGLVRCVGSVDIRKKAPYSLDPSSSPDHEVGHQDTFIERVTSYSSGKSPCKYVSNDIITTYGFEKLSDNSGENSTYDSSKVGISSRSDKHSGKVIKCRHCSQTYLNKHVCLRMRNNGILPEMKTIKKNVHDFDGAGSGSVAGSSSVHRSHSLGNVNVTNGKSKNFRYSLNIDNDILDCDTSVVDMDLEDCCKVSSVPSLTDTFGSHSKAADSGYPNSVHDMDLDLTPEQVDEIITETESSLEDEDSSAEDRVEEVPGNAAVVFLDEVENGDVANNNRDGEGNNMEGRDVVEVLNFEGLVMEVADPVVEADQHESDDEGLYLSALDVSNETLVPEETSSHEETLFNSVFEGHSSISSAFRAVDSDVSVQAEEPCHHDFPPWLLNILMSDDEHQSDSGISIGQENILNATDDYSSFIVMNDVEVEAQIEVTVPIDVYGGGDSTSTT